MDKSLYVILLASLVVLPFIIYFIVSPTPCGYIDEKGNISIECHCIGITKDIHTTKGRVINQNIVRYCHGISETKLCEEINSIKQNPSLHLCN